MKQMFHKFDLFEDVVDKQTLKIKNYDLAYKLKRHLGCDSDFNAYATSRDMGIMDYVSRMKSVRESNYRPSLLDLAITLLENDLPLKRVSDITSLDFEFIEKLDLFYFDDAQNTCSADTEIKYEIARCLLELPFLTDEDIAKKAKLTINEVEGLREGR